MTINPHVWYLLSTAVKLGFAFHDIPILWRLDRTTHRFDWLSMTFERPRGSAWRET